MPLGNGDIGLNVWVEPEGDVLFYISKTDAWGGEKDSSADQWMQQGGVLMKLGLIRISSWPNEFAAGDPFRQTLRLGDGEIRITEGEGPNAINYRIWVDANHPVIHVEASGARPFKTIVTLHDWRLQKGDAIVSGQPREISWYHHNPALGDPRLADPHLAGITFGAILGGSGLYRRDDSTLESNMPSTSRLVSITALTAKTPTAADYLGQLYRQARLTDGLDLQTARVAHQEWWHKFWDRSYIYLHGDATADSITRGYVLQRYVTACAGRGAYPIKFNGSIFVVDNRGWTENGHPAPMNADFRAWGGQYWFQNTRPMYWPRLMAGDFDLMLPLFRMYAGMLAGNSALVRQYYGHGGAYFQETSPFWGGLPFMGPGEQALYTHHYFTPILELSMMMLDYYEYTENEEFARRYLLPIASAGVEFYKQHFPRDSSGHLLLDPDNSIEMYWKVHDPAPDIAGLHAVLPRMLALPVSLTTDSLRRSWRSLLSILPPLPIDSTEGAPRLLPYTGPQTAQSHNFENPELYAIYPFRLYGLGRADLDLARHTFDIRKCPQQGCWSQDPIQAAMLGYTDIAKEDVRFALTRKDPGLKFPAFWATGHDYRPDEDNGGNGENGLQKMLLQTNGRKILLLPAWPPDWDADFRLHAPYRTIVEGQVRHGRLVHFVVTPTSRLADVVDCTKAATANSSAGGAVAPASGAVGPEAPYLNPRLPLTVRVHDLLSRLTLEEKVSQMMNRSPAIDRLHIPAYNWWNEGLHGVARTGKHATVFPQAIGNAATFDEPGLQKMATMISTEARAIHHQYEREGERDIYEGLTFWSPNINIFRDPRWGRGQETYGEDPYLTGQMGAALVKGFQGDDPRYLKTTACAKHFAVHSGPESTRHSFDVRPSPYDLWDTYLPAFRALVVDAKVASVMCAYNAFDGQPCCGSDVLMTDILYNKWKFHGYVTSDCGAIDDFYQTRYKSHNFSPDASTAASDAVIHGTDVECGGSYRYLVEAVHHQLIPESKIDTAVSHLLEIRFRLGMFDPPAMVKYAQIPMTEVQSPAHRAQALQMARESIVLLKNEGHLLPLDAKHIPKIAVVGPNAADSSVVLGNYNGFPDHTVTVLEGIRNRLGTGTEVQYERGVDWVQADSAGDAGLQAVADRVRDADVIVFVGGISPRLEGEEMPVKVEGFSGGDRTSIALPAIQTRMMQALHATGKPVIFVMMTGSALSTEWESAHLPAILNAWYGGEAAGTAVADVLFGDYNPAGRLPVTFYRSVDQLPDFSDYSMEGRTYRYFKGDPLYPFGYGLSYTTFAYSGLTVPAMAPTRASVPVTVTVQNTGGKEGDEVVQLYIRHSDVQGRAPIHALVGFARIHLAPGEKKIVRFSLSPRALSLVDEQGHRAEKPGKVEIFAGGGQPLPAALPDGSVVAKTITLSGHALALKD
jgi:beta-glucosidase-like glycosyl hydrolase